MCHAREQLGDLLPPSTPSLPSPPARPPLRPAPTCLPCDSLAGRPAAAAGRVGWRAGGRAGGGLPGPGHGAPDLGATPSREGGEGRKERQPAGRGGGRSRRCLRPPSAAPRRAPCCPAAHSGVRSSGLPLAGGGVLLRVSRFRRFPTPPRGRWAQLLPSSPPTRPPGPVAVTLAAPAQRPPSAHPAPSGLQGDPWRLGGPLAPKQLLTSSNDDAAGH
ncbi:unnamed protein product [Pipistrellus nathusii]|uniref:Uncharacterized protein n=1 Tax=Pipistrellus nathusii TaxID=59473 RepID=A0ABN9ZMB1_PIPNA